MRSGVKALLLFFKLSLRRGCSAAHVVADLQKMGCDEDQSALIADMWKVVVCTAFGPGSIRISHAASPV